MDAEDVAHALELREHARELLDARDLKRRVHRRGLVRIGLRRKAEQLHLVRADHGRDVAKKAVPIPPFDADRDRIRARRRALPLDVDEALFVRRPLHIRAVGAMHRDAAAASDVSHDLVARHGIAAHAEADEEIADTLHVDAAARGVRRHGRRDLGNGELRVVGDAQTRYYLRGGERAVAERGEERVHVVQVQRLGHAAKVLVRDVTELALRDAPELLVEELFAVGDVLVALRALKPRADLLARAGRAHHPEPVARRPARRLAGDDLDDVARRETVVEWHDPAVDLRADRAMPDVGVDPVREVDRRRARGKALDLSLRREDEDLVLEDVDLERLDELLRVGHVVLPLEQLADPRELGLVVAVALAALLVAPVRGDAVPSEVVHVASAHLDLDRLPAGADDRGMEGLVHIRLGHGDVVVELPGYRRPERVHHAERGVAGGHVVDDRADRENVVDLFEADALAAHLLRDRPEVLRAP